MTGAETPITESELLGKFFAGDESAFRALYTLYYRKIVIFGIKMLGSKEAAEDLIQDLWIKIIDQRGKVETIEHVGGYIFRIAQNLALDKLRARKPHTSIESIAESDHPTDDIRETSDLEDLVMEALDSLPPEDKELLTMNAYLGYGYDEIAEMKGKSPEAIWTRASRARARIREKVTRTMSAAKQHNGSNNDDGR